MGPSSRTITLQMHDIPLTHTLQDVFDDEVAKEDELLQVYDNLGICRVNRWFMDLPPGLPSSEASDQRRALNRFLGNKVATSPESTRPLRIWPDQTLMRAYGCQHNTHLHAMPSSRDVDNSTSYMTFSKKTTDPRLEPIPPNLLPRLHRLAIHVFSEHTMSPPRPARKGLVEYFAFVQLTFEQTSLPSALEQVDLGTIVLREPWKEHNTLKALQNALPAIQSALLDKRKFHRLKTLNIKLSASTPQSLQMLQEACKGLMPVILAHGVLDMELFYSTFPFSSPRSLDEKADLASVGKFEGTLLASLYMHTAIRLIQWIIKFLSPYVLGMHFSTTNTLVMIFSALAVNHKLMQM